MQSQNVSDNDLIEKIEKLAASINEETLIMYPRWSGSGKEFCHNKEAQKALNDLLETYKALRNFNP